MESKETTEIPKFLTAGQLRKMLGLSENTMNKLFSHLEYRPIKDGNKRLFPYDDVIRMIRSGKPILEYRKQ